VDLTVDTNVSEEYAASMFRASNDVLATETASVFIFNVFVSSVEIISGQKDVT
jgi:hypothetical protein